MTPLSIACSEGHQEVVEALIALGARLDIVDEDEKSVLAWAAEQNQPQVIRVREKFFKKPFSFCVSTFNFLELVSASKRPRSLGLE